MTKHFFDMMEYKTDIKLRQLRVKPRNDSRAFILQLWEVIWLYKASSMVCVSTIFNVIKKALFCVSLYSCFVLLWCEIETQIALMRFSQFRQLAT